MTSSLARARPGALPAIAPHLAPAPPPAAGSALPPVHPSRARRALRTHRAMPYVRLIAAVVVVNAAVAAHGALVAGWWSSGPTDLHALSTMAQADLVLAVLARQPWVVNLVGWLATRPRTRPPLRVRWALGKYYHLGGLHVGGAVAGTAWYLALVASLVLDRARGVGDVRAANLVLSGLVASVLVAMAVVARPSRRSRDHDRFEVTHRLGGWLALVLVWANAVVLVDARRGGEPLASALAATPAVLMLAVTTLCAVWPWLLLRRVPVTVERPSSHVAIVSLDHRAPPIGTTRPISRRPLVGWHHFANVPATSGRDGHRMVVSRAGDWTGAFVDRPPTHVWVRGVPAVGVANVRRLFERVVFVVTGSGIGPALGHLLADETPSRLVWVTRDPRSTYGDELVDEIERAQPDATVWSTDELGKPDVLRLAHDAYVESGAEAVICISNQAVTRRVVEGLEQRGVPAFGPIWDS